MLNEFLSHTCCCLSAATNKGKESFCLLFPGARYIKEVVLFGYLLFTHVLTIEFMLLLAPPKQTTLPEFVVSDQQRRGQPLSFHIMDQLF